MMNIMHIMNTASVGLIAIVMILVSFLSAKSCLVVSNLAKTVDKN